MRLIIGLGNPGKEYLNSRHNVGFRVVDRFAEKKQLKINQKKFNGLYVSFLHNDEKIMLLKPQCFMNNSGEVVKKFIDYYQISVEDILVLYDDYYIEVGDFKLKASGSSAGHNGLKSIEKHIDSKNYKRIKIGISRDQQMLLSDYVLSKFSKEQLKEIDKITEKLVIVLDDYLDWDFDKLMSIYNEKKDKV